MKNTPYLLFFLFMFFTSISGFCEEKLSPRMDWSTGTLHIGVSSPLPLGMSPSDHPKALEHMEQTLASLLTLELKKLPWNNTETLADLVANSPDLYLSIENIASTFNREWSRLSSDRKYFDASYTIDLSNITANHLLSKPAIPSPPRPIGWIPVPDDPWTGLVIFVPSELIVRGTKRFAKLEPALSARLLGSKLQVLIDPSAGGGKALRYFTLNQKEEIAMRVGRRPYRTMARELYGKIPCDIILGNDDTQKILASDSSRHSLSQGQIAIILEN